MIKIIYRQRKGTLKCLKENHKCQAQSQLYQNAIHCNWLSVEERGNNCQIQCYISQTVIHLTTENVVFVVTPNSQHARAFLIFAKRRYSQKSEMRLQFLVTTIQNMVLVILHQLYTTAVNFFASTLAKHIFCACANRLTASTDTRI